MTSPAAVVSAVVVLMQQHVTHISKHRFPLARPYIYVCVCVCRELIELNLTLLEAITNTGSIFHPSSSCSGARITRDGITYIWMSRVGWHMSGLYIHVQHVTRKYLPINLYL